MWGGAGVIARCRVRIASPSRLRFSPLEIFPQRQFQPVLTPVAGGPAFAFVLVSRHREPVEPGSVRTSNRPVTAAAATSRFLPATMASLQGSGRRIAKTTPCKDRVDTGPRRFGEESGTKSARNRPIEGSHGDSTLISTVLRACQTPPALAQAGGLWQGSARSAGVHWADSRVRSMLP